MRTVKEVSDLTGVSVRTLHHYDAIGLLKPAEVTEAGYRLYDDANLERLQQILLFRELQFPLKEIRTILDSPSFDRKKALEQQIELLTLKKEHIENLITLARGIKLTGEKHMDFTAFDTKKLDEYAARAKASWGNTPEYQAFLEKDKGRTPVEQQGLAADMMEIFADFGRIRDTDPASAEARALVKRLQSFITEHFYPCSNEILLSLGRMYAGGGEFTENIDKASGEGTGEFVYQAIAAHCS